MRRGFTMIELIFVIVIIGVLAVLAIPRLAATKDDAKVVTELNNLVTCVQDIGSKYTATGEEDNTSDACKQLKCFEISRQTMNSDGNITIDWYGDSTYKTKKLDWCIDARKAAEKKGMGDNVVKSFGGSRIKL